jgi:hypothetical protein
MAEKLHRLDDEQVDFFAPAASAATVRIKQRGASARTLHKWTRRRGPGHRSSTPYLAPPRRFRVVVVAGTEHGVDDSAVNRHHRNLPSAV